MIIKQIVIPLKMSRDKDLDGDGKAVKAGDWVMMC